MSFLVEEGTVGVEPATYFGFEPSIPFSPSLELVLKNSAEEARKRNHNYIGTEHLILSLLEEVGDPAVRLLANLGTDTIKIKSAVNSIIGKGASVPIGEPVLLTPNATKVLELACTEAGYKGRSQVSTLNLLIGLIQEGEAIAASVLESFRINLDNVRAEIHKGEDQSGSRSSGTA